MCVFDMDEWGETNRIDRFSNDLCWTRVLVYTYDARESHVGKICNRMKIYRYSNICTKHTDGKYRKCILISILLEQGLQLHAWILCEIHIKHIFMTQMDALSLTTSNYFRWHSFIWTTLHVHLIIIHSIIHSKSTRGNNLDISGKCLFYFNFALFRNFTRPALRKFALCLRFFTSPLLWPSTNPTPQLCRPSTSPHFHSSAPPPQYQKILGFRW